MADRRRRRRPPGRGTPGKGRGPGQPAAPRPSLTRVLVTYAAVLGVSLLLYEWLVQSGLLDPYLASNAQGTGWLLRLTGRSIQVDGNYILSRPFSLALVAECTSLGATVFFIAGVLAVPAQVKGKLLGIALGVLVLFLVNLARTTSLFYIGVLFPSALDVAHQLVWQGLMIILALALWLLWARQWVLRARS